MIKCTKIQEQFSDYLDKSLTEVANSDFEKHLNTCENCKRELEEFKSFISILDNDKMEKPSANLHMIFDEILAQEIKVNTPKVVQLYPKEKWESYLRVAASIVIVLSAFLLGKYQSNTNSIKENTAQVLAQLEDSSASTRIAAVTSAETFSTKDTKILQALINRLFFDKNANVRLAAAEALSNFSKEIIVRDALIKSLETDKNTTVQLELIQILSKIQEKRAIKPMEKMLENEETPQYVKQQLKLNLSNLL